ncbi:MAG: FtsQ-type POTRA domain-containing protein [Victivallaceae bacterium]|nr:FtsQ-type POTRA domain-containing protein [Victivallaceae bacterium]
MALGNKKRPQEVVSEFERGTILRGMVVFIILLLIAGSVGFGCYVLKLHLFNDNPNFTLKRFLVSSTALDSSRWVGDAAAAELAGVMGVRTGETNLFGVELDELRQRALYACPGIERIAVERQLPDTIRVRITERMPQAVVFFIGPDGRRLGMADDVRRRACGIAPAGLLLADYDSVLMARGDCAPVDPALLAQITFQVRSVSRQGSLVEACPGEVYPALRIPMALLRESKKRKSLLELKAIALEVGDERINVAQVKKMTVMFSFDGHVGTAVLPMENAAGRLDDLEDAVRQSVLEEGAAGNVYNLLFENQVVKK